MEESVGSLARGNEKPLVDSDFLMNHLEARGACHDVGLGVGGGLVFDDEFKGVVNVVAVVDEP